MENNVSLIVVVAVISLALTSGQLRCVDCTNTRCIPPPPSCEPGLRPCSCCMECRIKLGGQCGPFSPECLSSLICLTNIGAYNGRPPYWLNAVGRCVTPNILLPPTSPIPQLTPTLPPLLIKMLSKIRK